MPITPQVADPYVNLGDDFDSFQLYDYDTVDGGYHVYPLDLDRDFGLSAGRGYFTRIEDAAEIDVGGTSNLIDVEIDLPDMGWYPIGNPFILSVNVADLKFNGSDFVTAVGNDWIESVLYKWVEGNSATFTTDVGGDTDIGCEGGVVALNAPSLPPELNAEFSANALSLTSPTVEVVFAGSAWRIHDGDTFYDVTYNGSQFKIKQNADFYQSVDSNGVLEPWEGYWLKTKVADLTLTIPAPNGIADAEAQLPISFTLPTAPPLALKQTSADPGGFNLRLMLTSDFAADLTTVLGTHPDAELGRDGMDNPEPPTLGNTILASRCIYFMVT